MLDVTPNDLAKLDTVITANPQFKVPSVKLSVYKNRRGSYRGCYLWCSANKGTCRFEPQFCTKWDYTLVPIDDIKVIVDDDEPCAW